MCTLAVEPTPRAQHVEITADELVVRLRDGRKVSAPQACFPRLLHATPDQRREWEFIGDGEGIHWRNLILRQRVGCGEVIEFHPALNAELLAPKHENLRHETDEHAPAWPLHGRASW
jgi:hypothetical protein